MEIQEKILNEEHVSFNMKTQVSEAQVIKHLRQEEHMIHLIKKRSKQK